MASCSGSATAEARVLKNGTEVIVSIHFRRSQSRSGRSGSGDAYPSDILVSRWCYFIDRERSSESGNGRGN